MNRGHPQEDLLGEIQAAGLELKRMENVLDALEPDGPNDFPLAARGESLNA